MTISGYFWKRYRYDAKTGYSTFMIKNEDDKTLPEFIYCVGKLARYVKMTPLLLTGDMQMMSNKNNETYSIFQVHTSKLHVSEENSFIKFLSSGICVGVGTATAKKIWDTMQGNPEEFVANKNASSELLKIKGLDPEKAMFIINIIKTNQIKKALFDFIEPHGGNFQIMERIYRSYKGNSIRELKSDPYKVALNCDLMFIFADSIAKEQQISYVSESRVGSLIRIAIKTATSFGNTYTTFDQILRYIREIEIQSAYEFEIPVFILLKELISHRSIKIEVKGDEVCFYHKNLWFKELGIAKELKRLETSKVIMPYREEYAGLEFGELFELDQSQKEVIGLSRETGVKLIIGKPGTGKTTIIKKIVSVQKRMNPDVEVLLLAPTGRAASRIKESTGYDAKTIHKGLEFAPYEAEETVSFNESNQFTADVIIVDEFSMVDTEIFYLLLRAVKNGALLLLVGDWHQLSSVGPGNLLFDIAESRMFPVYELKRIHRQSEDSIIVENSNRITDGNCDLLQNDQFRIYQFPTEQELKEMAKKIAKESHRVDNPFHTQLLSPSKKNIAGVTALNEECQEFLNPYGKGTENSFYYGNQEYVIGDKIIMLKNNYKNGYVNGDIGVIENFDDGGIYVKFTEDDPLYIKEDDFEEMTLSYAITIHKSQGSECEHAIIVLSKNPAIMLERSVLYTGVTRAKKKVDILSQDDAIYDAIKNHTKKDRKTGLKERIWFVFEKERVS